eukprot:5957571-Amphidinium_carterae.8
MSPDRDDLFAATSSSITSRVVDAYAMKYELPTFTADVTQAYLQVREGELVFVLAPPEYEEWCRRNGHTQERWWRMKKMLYGRRPALWIISRHVVSVSLRVHHTSSSMQKISVWWNYLWTTSTYGTGSMSAVEKFKKELEERMKLKRFVIHRVPDKEVKYDHLKRLRVRTESSMQIHPNSKHTAM